MDEFNMDAAASSLASDLGLSNEPAQAPAPESGSEGAASAPAPAPESGQAASQAGGDPNAQGAAGAPAPAPATDAQAQVTDPAAAAPAAPVAPKSWKPGPASKFASADPELQAEILRREEDFHKGIEGFKGDAAVGRSVKQVIAPYEATFRQYGIDPTQQIASLLNAHFTLATGTREQKAELYQRIARDYGIEVGPAPEPGYVDPEVARLREEVQALRSTQTAEQQRRFAETKTSLERQVEAFGSDPKNAYFEEVLPDMTQLLQSGVCSTLQEAYEKAIWTNPGVRAKEVARQQQEAITKAEADRVAKAKADAEKAAKAKAASAANVKTSAKAVSATAPLGSLDDTLNEQYAAIMARG